MLALAHPGAHAASISFWNAPEGGAFQNAQNWSGASVPNVNDIAWFRLGGSYTVQVSSLVFSAGLVIGHDDVTFDLGNGTYVLSGDEPASLRLGVEPADHAMLRVLNGRLETIDAEFGSDAAASGTLRFSGAGARFAPARRVLVGVFGDGRLVLENGARMTQIDPDAALRIGFGAGSTGVVEVRGGSSRISTQTGINVGDAGAGTLRIESGAAVTSASGGVGLDAVGSGAVRIDGAGSRWIVGGEIVSGAHGGDASIALSQGGRIEAGAITLGAHSTLRFELGSPGLAAPVTVAGDASLGGALEIGFAPGPTPTKGDVFDLLVAGAVDGAFASVVFDDRGTASLFRLDVLPDRVRLTVIPAPGVGLALAVCLGSVGAARRRRPGA